MKLAGGLSSATTLLMTAAALTWFLPILWMISLALTPDKTLEQSSSHLFPRALYDPEEFHRCIPGQSRLDGGLSTASW